MSKHKRQSKGPYVAVPKAILDAPAWRAMSPEGRLLWIDLRGWLRNDGLNNGKMLRSCRAAAKSLGFNRDTIAHKFAENEHYGFLRKTSDGFLGSDGRGIAAKYRFTDLAHGTHPPTRDFEKWDGEIFVYTPRRPKKNSLTSTKPWKAEGMSRAAWYRKRRGIGRGVRQNPVLSHRTPRPVSPDIQSHPSGGSVCLVSPDIESHDNCPVSPDISRLPLGGAVVRGSSAVRAPVKAGGAGSSPALVASDERGRSDGLMSYVASVIEEQLNNLDHASATLSCERLGIAMANDDTISRCQMAFGSWADASSQRSGSF
jgi:hypothetical protein